MKKNTEEGETGKLSDIFSKIWSNYEFLESTDLASTDAEYQVILNLNYSFLVLITFLFRLSCILFLSRIFNLFLLLRCIFFKYKTHFNCLLSLQKNKIWISQDFFLHFGLLKLNQIQKYCFWQKIQIVFFNLCPFFVFVIEILQNGFSSRDLFREIHVGLKYNFFVFLHYPLSKKCFH